MEERTPHKIIHGDQCFAIVGCAFEVLNTIGHGLNEKPYENALAVELRLRGIPFEQQHRYSVDYKGVAVGDYIPDLVAYRSVIVDTKVVDHISEYDRGQMLNYLRITKLKVGVILNFKCAALEWERLVL
jgi:GxxExxY protein